MVSRKEVQDSCKSVPTFHIRYFTFVFKVYCFEYNNLFDISLGVHFITKMTPLGTINYFPFYTVWNKYAKNDAKPNFSKSAITKLSK